MTTIIATKEFMLSDRCCADATHKPSGKIVKHKITSDRKAIIAVVGTFCSQEQLFDVLDKGYLEFKKFINNDSYNVDDDYNFIVIYENEVYMSDDDEFELLNGDLIVGIGSGAVNAKMFLSMGIPPERVMQHTHNMDRFTTPDCDLTYVRDL